MLKVVSFHKNYSVLILRVVFFIIKKLCIFIKKLNSISFKNCIRTPPERYTQSTVADMFVTGTTDWNLQEIRRICPVYEQQILSIKPSKNGAKDKMVWLGTKSGEYSTKTGYAVASLSQVDEDDQTNQNMADFNWNKSV